MLPIDELRAHSARAHELLDRVGFPFERPRRLYAAIGPKDASNAVVIDAEADPIALEIATTMATSCLGRGMAVVIGYDNLATCRLCIRSLRMRCMDRLAELAQ